MTRQRYTPTSITISLDADTRFLREIYVDDTCFVRVIRCRDCRHFTRGEFCNLQDEFNEFHWLDVEPNGYCAWATAK